MTVAVSWCNNKSLLENEDEISKDSKVRSKKADDNEEDDFGSRKVVINNNEDDSLDVI